jgi:hypothetical protein
VPAPSPPLSSLSTLSLNVSNDNSFFRETKRFRPDIQSLKGVQSRKSHLKKKRDSSKDSIPDYVFEVLPSNIRFKLFPPSSPSGVSDHQSHSSSSSFSRGPFLNTSYSMSPSSSLSFSSGITNYNNLASSSLQPPLFTADDVTVCINKAIEVHEEKLNRKFEQILQEKLQGLRMLFCYHFFFF